jgi:hypothetical protein
VTQDELRALIEDPVRNPPVPGGTCANCGDACPRAGFGAMHMSANYPRHDGGRFPGGLLCARCQAPTREGKPLPDPHPYEWSSDSSMGSKLA